MSNEVQQYSSERWGKNEDARERYTYNTIVDQTGEIKNEDIHTSVKTERERERERAKLTLKYPSWR